MPKLSFDKPPTSDKKSVPLNPLIVLTTFPLIVGLAAFYLVSTALFSIEHPMSIPLLLIAAFTLGTGAVALFLKNIIRAALLLTATWIGIAAFYLWAGAEFVAFAQVLVYVGAISMVVLFAVLLTRKHQNDTTAEEGRFRVWGKIAAALVAAVLYYAITTTPLAANDTAAPALTVKQIGEQLMGPHVGALLIIGVLLTVALLGAVLLAAPDVGASLAKPAGTPKNPATPLASNDTAVASSFDDTSGPPTSTGQSHLA